MVGAAKTTCMLNINDGSANWDNQEPMCQLLCNEVIQIDNGIVECDSDTNSIGNNCKYSCNEGYRLIGNEETTCHFTENGTAIWDESAPYCQGSIFLIFIKF